ncbi:MAG: hypothetical protein RSD47_07040 [Romboutsia sp.]
MKKVLFSAIFIIGIFSSCTDSRMAKFQSLGSRHSVELLDCSGNVIRKWISTGKVLSEAKSDGYYFTDEASVKLIEVTGTLIITRL